VTALLSRTASKFLAVGIANTMAGLAVIYGAKWLFRLGDIAANVAGYAVGLALSFLLNKHWTFRFDGDSRMAAFRFLGAFMLAYSVNLMTVLTCIRVLGMDGYLAQAIGVIPYTVSFYALSKGFVFRRPDAGT
jgi:putative flippase GtrA